MKFIYLHGFASGPSSKKARYFRERFADRGIDLVIPDLNDGDFDHLTISGQLQIIHDAAGSESVRLIGSSLGGYLAALTASRNQRVERLVMMAPAFNFVARWNERLGSETMSSWQQTGVIPVESYADGRIHHLHYAFIVDAAAFEQLPLFEQPAVIFHGRRDDTVPVGYSLEYAQGRPNIDLRLFDSGHELVDVLDRMWPVIENFLLD